jgi:hypothetical protein
MQQIQQLQSMEIQGTLQNMARGHLVVLDDKNQQWQVIVPMTAKLHVTGTASPDFLRNGQLIQLTAEIDDHGTMKDKVDELTIVSPTPENQMGVYPAESGEADKAGPPSNAAAPGEKKPVKQPRPPKRPSGKNTSNAIAAGTYRLVGRLMVGKNNKLSIHVGHGTLPLELSDQPTIHVDVSDISAVSRGDQVKVKGVMRTDRPGMAQALEVWIELSQTIGGGAKKQPGHAESKRSSKPSQKEQGLPEQPENH